MNVVATASINQVIDLDPLAEVGGFHYDLAIYHCAYLKDRLTKGKVSIFATGRMISIGTKNPRDAVADLRHAVERLVELNLAKRTQISPKIRNIVARCELGSMVDLEALASSDLRVIYEPGQFPAAICWPSGLHGAVVSIFSTGKIVVSGLKNTQGVRAAEGIISELLSKFRFSN